MGTWDAFEPDPEFVHDELQRGNLDYVEVASQVAETRFFEFLFTEAPWRSLVDTFPSPRRKEDVPLWVYLSSQITLRLHGATGYGAYPYVINAGGLKDVLGDEQARWRQDEETKRWVLECKGYNFKNSYDRKTPCDPDYLRKMARDTSRAELEEWMSADVPRFFHQAGVWDNDGIIIVDGSYLFVPDNKRYEGSSVLLFDENNHPIDPGKLPGMTDNEKIRIRRRRCYRTVNLMHTNRQKDFAIYAGLKMGDGKMAEAPCLLPMMQRCVAAMPKKAVRLAIFDKGFIDGQSIARMKRELEIDSLFPMREDMLDWKDALRLSEIDGKPWLTWRPPQPASPVVPPQRPAWIQKREDNRRKTVNLKKARRLANGELSLPVLIDRVEMKLIPDMNLWESCGVPISVLVLREHLTDGTVSTRGLGTTREKIDPLDVWELYKIRDTIEEGYRQTKCFWDLTGFRSCKSELVFAQVAFTILAFSLMQTFLVKGERGDLAGRSRNRIWESLLPQGDKILVYAGNRVAFLDAVTFAQWLLNVEPGARRRLNGRLKILQRQKAVLPLLPQRPTGFQP